MKAELSDKHFDLILLSLGVAINVAHSQGIGELATDLMDLATNLIRQRSVPRVPEGV